MSQITVVIVDDHEVVRLGLRRLLEHQPNIVVVDEAASAEEAVSKVLQHRPDVVVMDIRLVASSGIEACREIKAQAPESRVIMLTSYDDDDLLFDSIAAGAVGYVLKRIGSDELVRAIESVGRGEALLDPTLTQKVLDRVRQMGHQEDVTAFDGLTDQERRVLALVAEGRTNREIAEVLFLGEGTIRNYVSNILGKLQLSNRAEAAAYAVSHNLRQLLPRD